MNMLDRTCKMLLKFEGQSLDDHTMAVEDLAPSLIALSTAVKRTNALLNNEEVKVSLSINAVVPGSFGIDLIVAQDILGQITSMFSSEGMTAYCNATTLVESLLGLFAFKKWLAGRKATFEKKDESSWNVKVDQNIYVITNNTYILYKDSECNSACSRVAAPLHSDGVDAMTLSSTKDIVTVSQDEVQGFEQVEEKELSSEVTYTTLCVLESVSFKEGNKWKVSLGDGTVYVTMADEEFLGKVNNGSERFGKGDVLSVELEIRQYFFQSGKVQQEYKVLKVYEHRKSNTQANLFE